MKTFKVHWLDGSVWVIQGANIVEACRFAGIGRGAAQAIDYWEEVPNEIPVEMKPEPE